MLKALYHSLFVVLITSVFSTLAYCEELALNRLFDGISLKGWHVLGEAQWSLEKGEMVSSGTGNGYIVTQDQFEHYTLSVDFWVDSSTNSGVFVGCSEADIIDPDKCYEINIWDDHPKQEARTGAVVKRAMPPLAHVNSVGKWNTYEIEVSPNSITVRLNGTITSELQYKQSSKGYIALQHFNSGTVRFRNILLK